MKNYELWAMGFNANEECTDFEVMIAEFPYTEEGKAAGLEKLRNITAEEIGTITTIPEDVKLLDLALEEVKDFSETERSAFNIAGTRWLEVNHAVS